MYLGRHKEALKCYDAALDIKNDDSVIWFEKGITLAQKREFEDSIDCFDKAIQLTPHGDYPDAWFEKGISKDCLGEHQEAKKLFDKALELVNLRIEDDYAQIEEDETNKRDLEDDYSILEEDLAQERDMLFGLE